MARPIRRRCDGAQPHLTLRCNNREAPCFKMPSASKLMSRIMPIVLGLAAVAMDSMAGEHGAGNAPLAISAGGTVRSLDTPLDVLDVGTVAQRAEHEDALAYVLGFDKQGLTVLHLFSLDPAQEAPPRGMALQLDASAERLGSTQESGRTLDAHGRPTPSRTVLVDVWLARDDKSVNGGPILETVDNDPTDGLGFNPVTTLEFHRWRRDGELAARSPIPEIEVPRERTRTVISQPRGVDLAFGPRASHVCGTSLSGTIWSAVLTEDPAKGWRLSDCQLLRQGGGTSPQIAAGTDGGAVLVYHNTTANVLRIERIGGGDGPRAARLRGVPADGSFDLVSVPNGNLLIAGIKNKIIVYPINVAFEVGPSLAAVIDRWPVLRVAAVRSSTGVFVVYQVAGAAQPLLRWGFFPLNALPDIEPVEGARVDSEEE